MDIFPLSDLIIRIKNTTDGKVVDIDLTNTSRTKLLLIREYLLKIGEKIKTDSAYTHANVLKTQFDVLQRLTDVNTTMLTEGDALRDCISELTKQWYRFRTIHTHTITVGGTPMTLHKALHGNEIPNDVKPTYISTLENTGGLILQNGGFTNAEPLQLKLNAIQQKLTELQTALDTKCASDTTSPECVFYTSVKQIVK
jgi:hypothetical protein